MVSTEIRVLCVGGEPDPLRVMAHSLQGNPDIRVEMATSGKAALELMSQSKFDVLVVDYLMREMNGLQLLRAIRSKGDEVPFILLAAEGREEVAVAALNDGADFYIWKTDDPASQCSKIAKVVRHLARRREGQDETGRIAERLQDMVDASPFASFAIDLEGSVIMWNTAAERVFGWNASEVMGEKIPTVPDSAMEEHLSSQNRVLAGESFAGLRLRWLRKDGSLIDLLVSEVPLIDKNDRIVGAMATAQDIGGQEASEIKLRRLNRLFALLSHANSATIRATNEQALFREICKIAVEEGDFRTAWIGLLHEESGEIRPVAFKGKTAGIEDLFASGINDDIGEQGPTGTAVRTGELALTRNLLSDPLPKQWRGIVSKYGLRSAAAMPIRIFDKVIGALTLYAAEENFFEEDQIVLLKEISFDVSHALEAMKLEEQRNRLQLISRKKERFNAAVLETAGAIIAVLDREGRIVRFNRTAERITGYTAEEVTGKYVWDLFIVPEEVDGVKSVFADLVAGDLPSEYENYWLTKNGSRRLIAWTNTALPETDGSIKFVIATGLDITEQRESEKALLTKERQLSSIYDNVTDILFFLSVEPDRRFRFVSVNQSFLDATGLSRGQVVGKYVHEVIPEPSLALALGNYDKAIGDKKTVRWSEITDYPKGRTYGEVAVTPMFDSKGRCTNLVGSVHDITKREAALDQLRQNEELFRTAFENATVGVCLIGTDGRFLRVNRTLCELLRYSKEELEQMNFNDVTHDEDKELGASNVRKTLAGERDSTSYEKRYIRKDGQVVWAFVTTTIVRNPVVEKSFFVTHILDITSRKLAEDMLRESEERFRALFDRSFEGLYIHDLNGRFLDANPATLSMLGYSKEEVRDLGLASLLDEEQLPVAVKTLKEVVETGTQKESSVYRLRKKNGDDVWVETRSSLVMKDNKPYAVLGLAHDITERRRAEAALRKSEERYHKLVKGMLEGVAYCQMLYDDRGRPANWIYLSVNDSFGKLTGLKDIVGKKVTEAIPGIDKVDPELFEIYGKVAKTGLPKTFESEIKSLGQWLRISVFSPEKDHFVAVFEDITERKKAEAQLLRSKEAAEAATAKAQTYLDFIAHDLTNILSPVMMYSELMSTDPRSNPWVQTTCAKIARQVEQAASFVRNTRRLSESERGESKKMAPVDLRTVIETKEEEIRGMYPKKRFKFAHVLPSDGSLNAMGKDYILEIIEEILDNAAKHGKTDDVQIDIGVSSFESSGGYGYWKIEIADYGPGIPDEMKKGLMAEVFEPENRFTRGIASSLPFMSLIAEHIGGRLRIEDRVPGDHTKGARIVLLVRKAVTDRREETPSN